jgi:DNA-binding NarL/FixJ family response regulator
VAAGGSVIDSQVVESLVAARQRRPASPIRRLTPRELSVLSQIAQGKNNETIAHELELSVPVFDRRRQ